MSWYDDTMDDSVKELEMFVVGSKIIKVEMAGSRTILTLDSGKRVVVRDMNECCAYTEVDSFLLNPASVDHIITSVEARDGYTSWYILADMEEVLKLSVAWSEGSGYYNYGFRIHVEEEK